jgi:hypothetical protein
MNIAKRLLVLEHALTQRRDARCRSVHDAAPVEERGGLPRSTTSQNRQRNEQPQQRPSAYRYSGSVLWPIAGTHERPVRSSSVAICIGPNPVPIAQNLQDGPTRRAGRGTAPHADYDVIDSILPANTHAMHGSGEGEDASRRRQTCSQLLQLVQGSVLQVLGKQRIIDCCRSPSSLGQQARAAQPLNRCAHLGYSGTTALDLCQ